MRIKKAFAHDRSSENLYKASWGKEDIKAIRHLNKNTAAAKQTMANMMGMPPSTSGGLEDYTHDLTEMARAGL